MNIQEPILLPKTENLFLNSDSQKHPLTENRTLQLMILTVGQKSQIPEKQAQSIIMNQPGESGIASVVNGL